MLYNVIHIYIYVRYILYIHTQLYIHIIYGYIHIIYVYIHIYIYMWVTNHLPTGMHIQVSPFNQYGAHHQRLQQRHSKAQNPFSAGWFIYKGIFQSKMDDLGVP